MIALRIWVADENETLRSIAINNRVSTQDLVSLNPHIEHPDQVIAGKQVVLPFTAESDRPFNPFNPFMKSNNSIPFCPIGPNPILNNWIPLTPLEQMSTTEYDVLIVGSGAEVELFFGGYASNGKVRGSGLGSSNGETRCCKCMHGTCRR